MNETMTQLYRRGLTVVSTRRGYGLYFTKGDTLQFLELQADNDHCADQLLQAAREKTGAANARILLAENQTLYLGSGRRCGYGMIAFLGLPLLRDRCVFQDAAVILAPSGRGFRRRRWGEEPDVVRNISGCGKVRSLPACGHLPRRGR